MVAKSGSNAEGAVDVVNPAGPTTLRARKHVTKAAEREWWRNLYDYHRGT